MSSRASYSDGLAMAAMNTYVLAEIRLLDTQANISQQIPHMFLSPTTYNSARVWTPCIDSLFERCTWELEFIVPRYLEGGEPVDGEEGYPVMVVSSGELMEQVGVLRRIKV